MPRLGEALANSWLALHSSKESQYEASVDEIRESLCALSTVNKSCLPETNESMTVESAALLARHTALRWPTQSFATFSKDIVGVDEDVPPSRPLQSMFPRVPSNCDPQPSEDLPSPRYADAPSGTSTPGPNSGTDLEQTPSKGAIANRDKCHSDKKVHNFPRTSASEVASQAHSGRCSRANTKSWRPLRSISPANNHPARRQTHVGIHQQRSTDLYVSIHAPIARLHGPCTEV